VDVQAYAHEFYRSRSGGKGNACLCGILAHAGTLLGMEVTFPFPDPSRVAFAGDWHGNSACAERVMEAAVLDGAQVLIQLGDFGLWPGALGEFYLKEMQALTGHYGIPVLWLDGNHEDFQQLDAMQADEHGLHQMSELLWHLPRGARWVWNGVSFCALGGATSLDRPHRTEGRSWWPQEEVAEKDVLEAVQGGAVDVLLLHDCPTGVDIPRIRHRDPLTTGWPPLELERAWDHRDVVRRVVQELLPARILHGHYHIRYTSEADFAEGYRTVVHGLGDDSWWGDNYLILDVDSMVRGY
jgi:hypothetical protein